MLASAGILLPHECPHLQQGVVKEFVDTQPKSLLAAGINGYGTPQFIAWLNQAASLPELALDHPDFDDLDVLIQRAQIRLSPAFISKKADSVFSQTAPALRRKRYPQTCPSPTARFVSFA